MLLKMRTVSDNSPRKSKNNFMFYNLFPKIVPFMIMWENIVEPDRPQMKIWRKRISRWVPKATYTDSEYVIFIAFPLLQWFTNVPLCCVLCTLPALLHIVEINSRFTQLTIGRRQSTGYFLLCSQYNQNVTKCAYLL
jgi:hypothetical protein